MLYSCPNQSIGLYLQAAMYMFFGCDNVWQFRGLYKKEAEQLGACAVILKFLDSEFGNDIVEIITCKSRIYADMIKVQEIKNADNGTNLVGEKAGIGNNIVNNENTSQDLEHMTITCQTSKRKRNKKKEKKKMRVDTQTPIGAVPTSQALHCSSQ